MLTNALLNSKIYALSAHSPWCLCLLHSLLARDNFLSRSIGLACEGAMDSALSKCGPGHRSVLFLVTVGNVAWTLHLKYLVVKFDRNNGSYNFCVRVFWMLFTAAAFHENATRRCMNSSFPSHWSRSFFKFFDTQILSVFTKKLELPRHVCCILTRLRCNEHSFLLNFYLS